jgi:hypothetical protein
LKELRETRVWLLAIQRKPLIEPASKLGPLVTECNELIAIFVSSVATAVKNRKPKSSPRSRDKHGTQE